MITSPIMKAALKTSGEFRHIIENVSVDEKLGDEGSDAWNAYWTDEEAYCEVAYVESTFREAGHINCDERTPGMNFEHARLKKILTKFATPMLRAAAKKREA